MGYLAYIIAGIKLLFTGGAATTEQTINGFLNDSAHINAWFFWITVVIWTVVWLLPLLFGRGKEKLKSGCFGVFFAIWPLAQLLIWWLNNNMANAYSPTEGVTDPAQFWVSFAFTVLIGLG